MPADVIGVYLLAGSVAHIGCSAGDTFAAGACGTGACGAAGGSVGVGVGAAAGIFALTRDGCARIGKIGVMPGGGGGTD